MHGGAPLPLALVAFAGSLLPCLAHGGPSLARWLAPSLVEGLCVVVCVGGPCMCAMVC